MNNCEIVLEESVNLVNEKPTAQQEADVLQYMEEFKRISQSVAFYKLGVTRLSARIYDLRSRGYLINDEYVTGEDRHGKKKKWKEYWLATA